MPDISVTWSSDPSGLLLQEAGNVSEEQQAKTRFLWTSYLRHAAPLMAEQALLQHELEASGGCDCLPLGFPPRQVAHALNQAADLEHSIVLQQERYLFMLSRFIFQVPIPHIPRSKPVGTGCDLFWNVSPLQSDRSWQGQSDEELFKAA